MKPFLAQGGSQTLDAIYLDTACVCSGVEPPSKVSFHSRMLYFTRESAFLLLQRVATDGLVDLMARFPTTTHFFVNAWTWGYEDILTAISARFGDKVGLLFDTTLFLLIRFQDTRGPL